MLKILAAATLGLALATGAHAQGDYPSKPIRFVLVSSAGSGGDAIGRLLADKMAPIVKGTFVMDNRPGAGGAIAPPTRSRRHAPDGYTIGLGGFTSHVLLPASEAEAGLRPGQGLRAGRPVRHRVDPADRDQRLSGEQLKEFIALVEEVAEALQYASWGIGSTGHFCGELLNQRAQEQDEPHALQVGGADPDRHAAAGSQARPTSTWRRARPW